MPRWKNHDRVVFEGRTATVLNASESGPPPSLGVLYVQFDDDGGPMYISATVAERARE